MNIMKQKRSAIFIITLLVCLSVKMTAGFVFPDSSESEDYSDDYFSLRMSPFDDYEGPVDMGLDVTDDEAPMFLRKALANATLSLDNSLNQYSEGLGKPRLLKAIARFYSKVINRDLNPETEVIATIGATEALFDILRAFTRPGDEWIIFEPFWSKYVPMVKLVYGVPRFTALKFIKTGDDLNGNDFLLDARELESLFNNRTRGIIFNNPNNPTGKIYTLKDLKVISDLAKKYDVMVISDEAHEWITYKPYKLIRMASVPGMFERTITVGSGSKSFSVAGWRVGWAYGPAEFIKRINYVHDFTVQSAATPQQIAVAVGFEHEYQNFNKPESYLLKNLQKSTNERDYIVQAFKDAGMLPIVPNGGYCLLASWPSAKYLQLLNQNAGANVEKKFADWVTANINVKGYAGSTFFSRGHSLRGRDHIRFCFHKKQETLRRARQNLMKMKSVSFIG